MKRERERDQRLNNSSGFDFCCEFVPVLLYGTVPPPLHPHSIAALHHPPISLLFVFVDSYEFHLTAELIGQLFHGLCMQV